MVPGGLIEIDVAEHVFIGLWRPPWRRRVLEVGIVLTVVMVLIPIVDFLLHVEVQGLALRPVRLLVRRACPFLAGRLGGRHLYPQGRSIQ